jgi:glycosyltransferase involved in cell wall biosynthesis
MNLADITPVILTFNEEVNIARTLEHLHWAENIIVLDSGSTDDTAWICQSNPRVQWHQRAFDTHSNQWNAATALAPTDWILALDADYIVPEELWKELTTLDTSRGPWGYRIRLDFCIRGRPLRASLLPPRICLFHRAHARYVQDGHTQDLQLEGPAGTLVHAIWHDDRKPFSRWWSNQKKYAALEAVKLRTSCWSTLSPQDKLRKATPFSPLAVAAWCLLGKGLVFDLPWGWIYTGQRVLAEAALVWCRWGPGFKQD